MKKPDISIIVPIYNSESYLELAIESIINQTIKNIEIILVNDGSKDGSLEICQRFQSKDNRIKIINQKNQGNAKARDNGLKEASGKYIMFMDSDDLYELDSCECMLNEIVKKDADYVIGNYQMIDEDGRKWSSPAFDTEKYQSMTLDINDHEKSFWVMNSTLWNKIFKADFLKKNNISFKVPCPAEDAYFVWMSYLAAEKGAYLSKVVYLYRNNPKSVSQSGSMKYFKAINRSYKMIYEALKEADGLGFYRYLYAKVYAYLLCNLIDSEMVTDEEKIQLLKTFEWYFKLSKELEVNVVHDSLKTIYDLIIAEKYEKVLKEMNVVKEYRKTIPVEVRKRMSFPTIEDYKKMEKFDDQFEGEE